MNASPREADEGERKVASGSNGLSAEMVVEIPLREDTPAGAFLRLILDNAPAVRHAEWRAHWYDTQQAGHWWREIRQHAAANLAILSQRREDREALVSFFAEDDTRVVSGRIARFDDKTLNLLFPRRRCLLPTIGVREEGISTIEEVLCGPRRWRRSELILFGLDALAGHGWMGDEAGRLLRSAACEVEMSALAGAETIATVPESVFRAARAADANLTSWGDFPSNASASRG